MAKNPEFPSLIRKKSHHDLNLMMMQIKPASYQSLTKIKGYDGYKAMDKHFTDIFVSLTAICVHFTEMIYEKLVNLLCS